MMRGGLILLLTLFAFYLVFLGYLYLFQRSILFHPTHERKARAGFDLDLPEGKIRVEVRNPGQPATLIYFPGNSEHWWDDPDDLARMLPGHTIYFPHYPGYGASEGAPSQGVFFRMAETLYDALRPGHRPVDLIGRSLGSGVTLYLATKRPIRKLVLVTPYDSIAALGAERYPLFPIRALIKDPFESIRYAPDLTIPVLILQAENDSMIPHSHTQKLLHAFRRTKPILVTLPGTDHGNIVDAPTYPGLLQNFLEGRR